MVTVEQTPKSAFAVDVGRRIRALRKQKGIKQKALADMLGYKSHTAIVDIEAGEQILSLETTVALAEALEVSIYVLLAEERRLTPREPEENPWAREVMRWARVRRVSYAQTLRDLADELDALVES